MKVNIKKIDFHISIEFIKLFFLPHVSVITSERIACLNVIWNLEVEVDNASFMLVHLNDFPLFTSDSISSPLYDIWRWLLC